MSSDLFQALANNTEVDGYRIDKVIGSGGFGITYLGHDLGLNKSVAIKEYLPRDLAVRVDNQSVRAASSSDKDDFTWGLQRFLDEARVLARFDHKNIVRVHRFFQANGTAYIVMEYVDGETLSSLLQREHTLSCQRLLSILDPVLSGLEIVHKGDVLHRDIKPGNIIIRDSGVPVLIDFGAARQAVGARSRSVTAIVTPGYAPIEQYSTRGRQGPWTDIYALGAICYRAMTGETPIDAPERVRRDPLVPLSKQSIPEGYPGFFPGAVDRALSVDAEERPRSIGEWRDMLEGRGEAGAVSAPTADELAKTESLPRDSRPAASTGQPQAPSGLPSRGLVFGGIGAVVVTGLVITLLSLGGRGPTPEPGRPGPPDITEPARQEAERQEAERQEAERQEAERQEAERQEAERQEAERQEAERQEAERQEAERQEAERQEAERQEAERQEAERQEAERQEAERQEAERQEAERQEAERQEAERQEAERQKQARNKTPGLVFRDCPDCPQMVPIRAGRFRMGDLSGAGDSEERPVRTVSISAFSAGRYEVTWNEWEACVRGGGCRHSGADKNWGKGIHPVFNVSWEDAKAYTDWLSRRTGKAYRLLSEVEWEYIARAGSTTEYPWGDRFSYNHANIGNREESGGYSEGSDRWTNTSPVGSFSPNDFGLYDTIGNVREWTEDCWNNNYSGAPSTGRAWTDGDCGKRVARGGDWFDSPRYARSAYRYRYSPSKRYSFTGFRVARTD